MVNLENRFRVQVSSPDGAEFYEAHIPMSRRLRPGVDVELADGQPWRWVGDGGPDDGPIEITLVDVLAAANYARVAKLDGHQDLDLHAVHTAHEQAISAALTAGRPELAERLRAELAAVAGPGLVSEEQGAQDLDIRPSSLNNLRLQYRSVCPPVLIAGSVRTKWFWAQTQWDRWRAQRPGKGWRHGQRSTRHRLRCPACDRMISVRIDPATRQATLRPHNRATGIPCDSPTITLTPAQLADLGGLQEQDGRPGGAGAAGNQRG
jgi:hypothetical protein